MFGTTRDRAILPRAGPSTGYIVEVRRQQALLKTGSLLSAIFNSTNFSSIVAYANGVVQRPLLESEE